MQKFLQALAGSQKYFVNYVSVAIFIVMAWIGGLKVVQYEADGIVPFVTNSPFFSYMYSKKDIVDNGKGKMVAEYHLQNGTYAVSYLIGAMICTIGTLVLLGIWFPKLGLIGGLLTFGMSIVTLSFLITTPETWVPNLGNPALGIAESPNHGFPYLSGAGRLVLKDIIMSAAGLIVASNAARRLLECCKSCAGK